MKKALALSAVALVLASGIATAAPGGSRYSGGGISQWERAQIARSAANLAQLKRQAWSDGRVTFFERQRIRFAEMRHNRLVAQARRS